MIAVQTIVDRMKSNLDAEGDERYIFDLDFKPAINSGVEIMVGIFNQAFGENKLAPESLRELSKTKIWQTNAYSRVSYSEADTGYPLWTIFAVYPKPTCNRNTGPIPLNDPSESKFRGDLSFVKSIYGAKRLTFEEWNENSQNVFMPGNTILGGTLTEYAYLDFSDYSSTTYTGNPGLYEITIRPDIPRELVAISFLKYPTPVTLITDNIEFPPSLTELITSLALGIISIKQGDGTTLASLSQKYSSLLISALS